MVNYDEALAVILSLSGILIFTSSSLFYIALNREKDASVARIRLYSYFPALLSFVLLLNLVFVAGFLLSVFSPSLDFDLIGVLAYAVGISLFFIMLTRAVTKKSGRHGKGNAA